MSLGPLLRALCQTTAHPLAATRCGTTWLCQIVHMLRSGGDMSYDEINLVIPCI